MNIDSLKEAFGKFTTGVTVVATHNVEVGNIGFTANSFSSVSLEPPLLLVCMGKQVSSFDAFENAEHFTISILNEEQADVAMIFATSPEDRFAQVKWEKDNNGQPLISNASAHFSCRQFDKKMAGDHLILIGEILSCSVNEAPGLAYGGKSFLTTSPVK